jgi:hypothetical protein
MLCKVVLESSFIFLTNTGFILQTKGHKMNATKMLKITRAYLESNDVAVIIVPVPEGDITEFLLQRYGIDALPLIITEII